MVDAARPVAVPPSDAWQPVTANDAVVNAVNHKRHFPAPAIPLLPSSPGGSGFGDETTGSFVELRPQ